MNLVVETPNRIDPEVFGGRYTEKADICPLGAIFLAILQRDFVMINGKAFYGAHQHIPGVSKVGLGYAMVIYDPNICNELSSVALSSVASQCLAVQLRWSTNRWRDSHNIWRHTSWNNRVFISLFYNNTRSNKRTPLARLLIVFSQLSDSAYTGRIKLDNSLPSDWPQQTNVTCYSVSF